jgi:outer membrane protein, multidrug efflux system
VSREVVRRALRRLHTFAAVTLLGIVALGFALGPSYVRPLSTSAEIWRTPRGIPSLAEVQWWRFFKDPVLQQLIRTALEQSKDIRLVVARVAEARARYERRADHRVA